MSKNPRTDEVSGSEQDESTFQELAARPVSNEEAKDIKGGINPQPLPPRGDPTAVE